ncbi:glutamine amidotransferase [Rubellimicrobium arenae]|uniref:glutamine amidotransferase n=1 Tax=Rubellimicrobium arenae TaxID=2817372 RepID=UPI001B316D98|nr:glutamine amidotransferase [Rubellimicrobium arenae]
MTRPPRALLAGESWTVHSIHQKGFDSFTTTDYAEGGGWLIAALEGAGWEVTYQPSHVAARDFPDTAEALRAWDAVILSDIGANTLLLHPDTFLRASPRPDRLLALRDYVAAGGGLIMVGGYLTFQGIEGKARYAGTAVEEALPVAISPQDDRVERPAGVAPRPAQAQSPVLAGLPDGEWPALLGYNRLTPKPGAEVLAMVGDDPLIVAGSFGDGRALAYASDCGPHWAPPAFVEWPGYAPLWANMAAWVAGRSG